MISVYIQNKLRLLVWSFDLLYRRLRPSKINGIFVTNIRITNVLELYGIELGRFKVISRTYNHTLKFVNVQNRQVSLIIIKY